MNLKFLPVVILSLWIAALSQSCADKNHTGIEETGDTQTEEEVPKFQYTVYSENYELFAEADAFVTGEKANVLAHLTILPGFRALDTGRVTLILSVNGEEIKHMLGKPTRKGVYSFDILPETQGKGTLKFEISNEMCSHELIVPDIFVFATLEEAEESAHNAEISNANTTVFTKEQSWKIDFATGNPLSEPFGQVIKTTAFVQASQGSEVIVTSKTCGIVLFNSGNMLEGRDVAFGQALFTVSGSNLSDNNITIKYTEAKNNFEKAKADFERSTELAKDKIISEKDLLSVKNQYENAKAVYENLSKDYNASGLTISSPQSGFIKQVFVKNGAYVEAGQPVVVISQNKSFVLNAEVPLKYAPILANIKTANIRSVNGNHSFSLEQLNGKVLSYGKAANNDNFLIPVNLQVENNGSFVAGSFVEIYLKTFSSDLSLVVPNTALLEEQGSYFVWVQITPELFEKREVFIGGSDGINSEIKNGISSSDRIVTRGAMLVKLAQSTGALDAHSGHVH